MLKYKCLDRDITYSCMYLYVFFIRIKIDKLIYISSPFSNQGLPAVNEFKFCLCTLSPNVCTLFIQ